MSVAEPKVIVFGLSKADRLDIGTVDSRKQVAFEPINNIGNRYGEPVKSPRSSRLRH